LHDANWPRVPARAHPLLLTPVPVYGIWVLIHAGIFVALASLMGRQMFEEESRAGADAFFYQIQNVLTLLEGGSTAEWFESPLLLVHAVRFAITSPFYLVQQAGWGSSAEALLMLPFMLPVLLARFGGRRRFIQALFVYTPLILSFRSVLTACSIAYLFMLLYADRPRKGAGLFSMVLANLSSAAVLCWILIAATHGKELVSRMRLRVWPVALFVVALLSLGASLDEKLRGLAEGGEGYEQQTNAAGGGEGGLVALLSRNTIYVSLSEGQYGRAAVYLALLLAVALIVGHLLLSRGISRSMKLFFMCAIPAFLVEGLGVVAFLFPVLWYLCGVRPGLPKLSAAPS
jgi:hypothetical protein